MFDLTRAVFALAALGVVLLVAVLYREGQLDEIRLPQWDRISGWVGRLIGEWADVDRAHDVWPADLDDELRVIAALHREAHRLDTYREETRNG